MAWVSFRLYIGGGLLETQDYAWGTLSLGNTLMWLLDSSDHSRLLHLSENWLVGNRSGVGEEGMMEGGRWKMGRWVVRGGDGYY